MFDHILNYIYIEFCFFFSIRKTFQFCPFFVYSKDVDIFFGKENKDKSISDVVLGLLSYFFTQILKKSR